MALAAIQGESCVPNGKIRVPLRRTLLSLADGSWTHKVLDFWDRCAPMLNVIPYATMLAPEMVVVGRGTVWYKKLLGYSWLLA